MRASAKKRPVNELVKKMHEILSYKRPGGA